MRYRGLPMGLTLTEALVVLAVLAIAGVFVLGATLRGPSAASIAQELTRLATLTRWNAVQESAPRTLLAVGGGEFLAVVDGSYQCDAQWGREVWTAPPRSWIGWPSMGLAFAPDGRPRRCDGSAVGNNTILVEGPRGDQAAVIVASLGRVRWERR